MRGGETRKRYLQACIGVAKSDPRWVRTMVADWEKLNEVEKMHHSMRPFHIAMLKLAMRKIGDPI